MLEGPFCIWDFGYGKNAPKDINEYLGRKVVFYDKVYTVVHVEPSDRHVYRVDGSVIPGAASLFMARWQGKDGQPEGMGANAATIAEPCKTICHWHPDVDFREDAEECARLYKAALAGNEEVGRQVPLRRSSLRGRRRTPGKVHRRARLLSGRTWWMVLRLDHSQRELRTRWKARMAP